MPLTVFERWTDYGEQCLMKVITGNLVVWDSGLRCRLFKLPITDPEDEAGFTEADITEANFQGYVEKAFGFDPPADPGGTGTWESLSDTICTFNRRWLVEPTPDPLLADAGVSNTVYGYYLIHFGSEYNPDRPLYYRFFNDGTILTPKDMNTPDVDQITIVPRLGLIGLEDVVCP